MTTRWDPEVAPVPSGARPAAPRRTEPISPARRCGGPIRVTAVFVGLAVALVVVALVSAALGQYNIGLADVANSVGHRLFGFAGVGHPIRDSFAESTLWDLRLPRIGLGMVVGATLAAGGALMQGVFGNPLAEPGVVGVSSGAAVGAAAVVVAGVSPLGEFTMPATAFLAGLITVLTVYALSRSRGRTEVVTLVLTGVAVNAVAGAGLALCLFFGSQTARDQIVFWQLGSLNGSRWSYLATVAPLAGLGLLAAWLLAGRLDLLALGDRAARHVGVHVERVRLVAIVVVAVMVAAAVAFCGVIGFVGLVVPHLMRMVLGPGHRVLVPASMLGGAVLLAAADLVARTAIAYADLPIGMLTALVGGPFFFWLLRRARARAGGWA